MSERNILSEMSFEISSTGEQSIDFNADTTQPSEFSLEIGTPAAGTVTYNFGDGLAYDKKTNTLYVDISHEVLQDSKLPISSIAILKLLSSYVKAEEGKVLSDNNFTDEHLQKLLSLRNYIHPSKHPASMIEGLAPVAKSGRYADLVGKPSKFPPSAHGHPLEAIEGLATALAGKSPLVHRHSLATQEKEGFLGTEDKKKIDNLSKVAQSNKYSDLDGIPDSFNPAIHSHDEKADLVDGKVPKSQIPEEYVVTGRDGKIPATLLPEDYLPVDREGNISIDKLPASVVLKDDDGKIPEEVIPDIIPKNLSELSDDEEHRLVTDEEKQRWDAKSEFDGSYNSLKDVPTEFNPTSHEHPQYAKSEDVTKSLLEKADSKDVFTKDEVNAKLDQKADKDSTYTKEEIDTKMSSVYHYKGSKEKYADLPTEGNQIGDVWNILTENIELGIKAGDNVSWDGKEWDILAGMLDLSDYVKKDDVVNHVVKDESGRIPHSVLPDDVVINEGNKVLSSNDYTDAEKQKVADATKDIGEMKETIQEILGGSGKSLAENVYFSEDLQTTYEIGNIKPEKGIATVPAKDKNLKQVWDSIFMQELNPSITPPSLSLEASKGSYEVGTEIIPTYSTTFVAGSYEYGPETGVEVTSWSVKDSRGETSEEGFGNFSSLLIEDSTSYTITAEASYSEGSVPVTNLGNEYAAGQIAAGSVKKTSTAVKGYRNSFYGTLTEKSDVTSTKIRGLKKSGKKLSNGSAFDISVPVGAMRVLFAYPDTLRDVSSVKDKNGMNAEIASSFQKSTMEVSGLDDYNPIDYKVYILDFANANDKANTFSVTI